MVTVPTPGVPTGLPSITLSVAPKVWPMRDTDPSRSALVMFDAATRANDPEPNPLEFDVIESQLVVVVTVHGQLIWVLTAILAVSPAGGDAISDPGPNV